MACGADTIPTKFFDFRAGQPTHSIIAPSGLTVGAHMLPRARAHDQLQFFDLRSSRIVLLIVVRFWEISPLEWGD